ncbi:hypothetical protein HRbin15_02710 [bacterium HR15]|nr:hypothetical protein HRbin15_02710 [bacterium HR15]
MKNSRAVFDWADFLWLAQELGHREVSEPLGEAAQRTAVSRAYYAAFCATRDYAVQQLSYHPQHSGKDHSELQKHLRRYGGQWTTVANKLEDLRKFRNQCDYEKQVQNLDSMVAQSLTLASEVFSQL